MAEKDLHVPNEAEVQREEERLMYLEFVQKIAQDAVPYLSTAYNNARDNSGPLKPTVEKVEETVKTVVGPAYETFKDVPVEALKFADRKVDESVTLAKSTSLAADIKEVGVVETAAGVAKSAYEKVEPIAKELSEKYEPVVEEHAASSWYNFNKIPLFNSVAKVVTPTAAYVSEKYNKTVQKTTDEGYQVSGFLPLVPTEKIAKVFNTTSHEPEAKQDPKSEVSSEAEDVD